MKKSINWILGEKLDMCGREGLFLPVLFSHSENMATLLYLDLLSLTAHHNITQEQISSTCLLRKPNLIRYDLVLDIR